MAFDSAPDPLALCRRNLYLGREMLRPHVPLVRSSYSFQLPHTFSYLDLQVPAAPCPGSGCRHPCRDGPEDSAGGRDSQVGRGTSFTIGGDSQVGEGDFVWAGHDLTLPHCAFQLVWPSLENLLGSGTHYGTCRRVCFRPVVLLCRAQHPTLAGEDPPKGPVAFHHLTNLEVPSA